SASLPPSEIDGQIISWDLGDVPQGTYSITVTAVIDPGPQPQDPQTAEVLISDASGQEITNGAGTTLGTKHIYIPLLLK
ncbi:MAG: hypothetical protein R3264_13490, partial [Anaerolineae bacterium]|nr:hypothetical protein [Anaerolineae bacterium]